MAMAWLPGLDDLLGFRRVDEPGVRIKRFSPDISAKINCLATVLLSVTEIAAKPNVVRCKDWIAAAQRGCQITPLENAFLVAAE
jgi:hypothetical protein